MGRFSDIVGTPEETVGIPEDSGSRFTTIQSSPDAYLADLPKKNFFQELPDALQRGYANVASNLAGTARWLTEKATQLPLHPLWWMEKAGLENVPDFLEMKLEEIEQFWEDYGGRPELAPDVEQTAGAFVASVLGEALPYVAGTIGLGAAAGVPAAAAFAFGIEGNQAYKDAIDSGANPREANLERYIVGGINSLIEISNLGRILRRAPGGVRAGKALIQHARNKAWSQLLKTGKDISVDLVKTSFEEALEEFLQGTTAELAPALLRDQEIPGGLTGFLHRRGSEALGGAIVGGVLGGAGAVPGMVQETFRTQRLPMYGPTTGGESVFDTPETKHWTETEIDGILEGREVDPLPAETAAGLGIEEPPKETAVEKFKRLMSQVPQTAIRRVTEAERTKERGQRAGQVEAIREEVKQGRITPEDADRLISEELKGQLPEATFDPFTEDQLTLQDWKDLVSEVYKSNLRTYEMVRAKTALTNIQKGIVPTRSEAKLLKQVFGPEAVSLTKRIPQTVWETIKQGALEVSALPRALKTSMDLSVMGLQNIVLAPSYPKQWLNNALAGFRLLGSEQYAQRVMMDIQTSRNARLYSESGLWFGEYGESPDAADEHFYSELAKRLPLIGRLVRASERAFVVAGNKFRADVFDTIVEQWDGAAVTDSDYKKLGSFINHATGRGSGKFFEEHGRTLSIVFFAPRWWASRVQLVGDGATSLVDMATGNRSPVSKVIAKDLLAAFGAGMTAMVLAAMAGAEVEYDWRSADFGKVKVGNTRVDFWAGYTPIMRTIGRLLTGETKSTKTGETYPIDRKETFMRYLQSKLAPVPGTIVELWEGKQFFGEPIPTMEDPAKLTEYILEKFTPLFIDDVVDACQFSDIKTGVLLAPAAFMGAGVQTYEPTPLNTEQDLKNTVALQYFRTNWNDLGPLAQKILRAQVPQIEEAERRSKAERENYDFLSQVVQRQMNAGRRVMKSLPDSVRTEMRVLGVTFGGLSDRLGRNWKLNKTRYNQYQEQVSRLANNILPNIVGMEGYDKLPTQVKVMLLEKAINAIKKAARNQVVSQAKMEDIERIVRGA